jgi:hypothetical protein
VITPALSPSASYRVVCGDAVRDQVKVLKVWRECGSDYSPDFADGAERYSWFYLRNPAGRGQVFFLEHAETGSVVGVLGLGAREFWRRGVKNPAGVLVDFVVHPDHRVFYPALLLQKFVHDRAVDVCRLIIGCPNEMSAPVIQRAGYRPVPFNRFARVVGFAGHLGRYAPHAMAVVPGRVIDSIDSILIRTRRLFGERIEWNWGNQFDERYDLLWHERCRSDVSIGCRNRRFLEWRFSEQPNRQYRLLEITRAKSTALLGYFVCEVVADTLSIADFLLPPDASVQRKALLALIVAARQSSVIRISMNVAGCDVLLASLAAAGFRERESQSMLIAESSGGAGDSGELGGAPWFFTQADVDA